MEITIKLHLNEVNGLLNVLGQLPTSANVWPLAVKIGQQKDEQLPKQEQEDAGKASGTD